ncbi:MAG: hypothetical protein EOP32_00380 [Rhodococcus sp. (in: high G+C Gram-positive bacteria)]|nr:MAG: hypothetical protein EOP32_00380 [Rhodococcus sp. (in: high G+C Gram-positive bacteria)]
MTTPGPDIVESIRVFTPLGLALHDLVSDTRVVDGLRVDARPVGGGRMSHAFQTRSGAYAFRGLEGMRSVEMAGTGERPSIPVGHEFDVSVVDLKARFVPLVLRVPAPTVGLISQAELDLAGALAESVPLEELPVYLFSSATRILPAHIAAVRAQLADASSGEPAAFARLEAVVDPDGPGRRSYSGLSDESGTVVVPFAYPRFGAVPGAIASVPAAGTRGEPTLERHWPLRILVHYEPAVLDRPPGLPAATLGSILTQRRAQVWTATVGLPGEAFDTTLRYGTELVLRTAGDMQSRLLIRASAP